MTTRLRQLGSTGPTVFPLALGCMGMSGGMYGPADENESIATIHAALDRGVTLLDTGDFYSVGATEVELSPEEATNLEQAIPPSAVAGTRYDAHQMRILDSER